MNARFLFVLGFLLVAAQGQDWPTYAHDMSRSGVTEASLSTDLKVAWTWTSPVPPQPAWGGSAKWDAYNKIRDLKPRLTFDAAFHVAVVGRHVFFGSSSDDQLHALDLATGEELWSVFADGPIRVAPTVVDGRVLFGSDDGCVYSIDAATGDLAWKRRLAPGDRRIVGNGRMVSVWPVRTGVGVLGDIGYACAGLFPAEGSYLCAFKLSDGTPVWRQKFADLPPQGPILVSATRIYVPTGRGNPAVFDRATGNKLFTAAGRGGTYALLTGDVLVNGPGKTGQLTVHPGSPDTLATFAGNRMVVRQGTSFLLSDRELSSLDREKYLRLTKARRDSQGKQGALTRAIKELGRPGANGKKPTKEEVAADRKRLRAELLEVGQRIDALSKGIAGCGLWKAPCAHPLALALAGDVLVCGGPGEVALHSVTDGRRLSSQPVEGKAYGLAIASGCLLVSTDRGRIHCFADGKGGGR